MKKYSMTRIPLEEIATIKRIYRQGKENSGYQDDPTRKRYNKEDYNSSIVSSETFFCDLSNKELVEVASRYAKLTPDTYISNIHYINYKEGDECKAHVDEWSSVRTFIILLNDDFEGGEFYIDGEDVPFKVGDVLEFDDKAIHGVKKVTKGNREVLVIWTLKIDSMAQV
jgi:predicted 2-oxoglutarate/Fe(II)-dependent dioxygenase YbiX